MSFDSLFDELFGLNYSRTSWRVQSKDGKAVLTLDIPGKSRDDVTVRFDKENGTLRCSIKDQEDRTFSVAAGSRVTASVKHGQLLLSIEKPKNHEEEIKID